MKKIFVSILTVSMMLMGTKAFAQLSTGDHRSSAGGGFTIFSIAGSDADKVDLPKIPGFFFGGSMDYAFSPIEGLSVEPGVYIFHYGKTFKYGLGTENKSYHANYISIPVHLKYTFPMDGAGFELAAFTGPRLNLGCGGSMFSTGKTYPGLKGLDAQWGFGLAATVQDAVVLRFGYETGLTNCIKDNKDLDFDDEIAHRNTLYVGIGFIF